MLFLPAAVFSQMNVLNVNYDHDQTGTNPQETTLSPQIDWTKFGKIGTLPVDGQVYAQPLYVSGVSINGKSYNVLYVVTMHNSVFAFDADAPQTVTPLWQVNLGPTVPSGLYNFTDIEPETGILSTPVIDAAKQIMYTVSDTLPAQSNGVPVFQLHALSLVDGHEMLGGPVKIAASVPGTGIENNNGVIAFDSTQQLQRLGLALSNGTLYVGFGSHGDCCAYHGWLFAYDASTLRQTAVLNSSPNGAGASFWQSGRAPAIGSDGSLFVVTANGDYDGTKNYGESILHLDGKGLSVLDWYTPNEWDYLNQQDMDLGSAGAILIPNTNLMVTGGKSGMLHLAHSDSLGHLGPDVTSTVQGVQVNTWGMYTTVLWNGAPGGPTVYEYEPGGALKAFQISNNQINSTILSQYTLQNYSLNAGLSVSSNGAQGGIVWLTTGNDSVSKVPGTLHALDATNLAHELWNSDLNGGREELGWLAKFSPPTVVNGRVYVATFSNAVSVYGLLPPASTTATAGTSAISSIVNSASYLSGPAAPGELVTIFGANLGPLSPAQANLDGDLISDNIENTQVMIGGTAAPILYASPNQINAVVPFAVAGSSAQVQVLYQGQATASTVFQVQPASPAIFALDGSGGGQGAILNQDGSINTPTNPAARGSVVVLFGTGGGLTTPSSEDGRLAALPYAAPVLPVSVTIDGQPAKIVYAGAAPGLVAGVLQINVVVPENATQAFYDQVVVTVGDYVGPSAIWVTVQ